MALKPREKSIMYGIKALSEVELLALILQSGTKNESVMIVSQRLIDKYGGIEQVVLQSKQELITNHGIGEVKAAKINAIKVICDLIIQSQKELRKIKSAKDVYEVTKHYSNCEQENLLVISLNIQNQILAIENVYQGTINQIVIHPREILHCGIKNLAFRIILVHNHPSGDLNPSIADIKTTEKLISAAQIIDLEISDHVIISKSGYYSMRENKVVDF